MICFSTSRAISLLSLPVKLNDIDEVVSESKGFFFSVFVLLFRCSTVSNLCITIEMLGLFLRRYDKTPEPK